MLPCRNNGRSPASPAARSAGIISVDIILCQLADITPPGDAHDFLWKLSAPQTEISAGIISVDIIPHHLRVRHYENLIREELA